MAFYSWINLPPLVRELGRFIRPTDEQIRPLLEEWEMIITEGNRRGVLSGLDGFNQPMAPLKYRMGRSRKTMNRRAGFGRSKGPRGDNLTTAEYQELTGPRLAPRRAESRVIRNLVTSHQRSSGANRWEVFGGWLDVVDVKGRPFLPYHFSESRGGARFPRYDLRPVRPDDLRLASEALGEWAMLRS